MEKGTVLVFHKNTDDISFTLDETLGDPSLFKSYKDGALIIIKVISPTSRERAALQRKFFAILNVVFENQDVWATKETLKDAVLCAIGFRDTIECMIMLDENGDVVGDEDKIPINYKMIKGISYRAKSISYENCSDAEFKQVYQKAEKFICDRILKVAPEALEAQVLEIMKGRK